MPGNNRPAAVKIQAALLLDVSNSMDGLIEQAKNQLWNMVLTISKLRCGEQRPDFEIALYEYGRPGNLAENGYIRQLSPFTRDADLLYSRLQALTTEGGEEHCPQAILQALQQLSWDTSSASYKTIFIAGNEEFRQGPYETDTVCELAESMGVIVNTLFCGSANLGQSLYWNLGYDCGGGTFNAIEQNEKDFWVPNVYDTTLIVLKRKYNETIIPYGERGRERLYSEMNYDKSTLNSGIHANNIAGYVSVKTSNELYDNSSWDLTEAFSLDSMVLDKIDSNLLSPGLARISKPKLKAFLQKQVAERKAIRDQIREAEKNQSALVEKARKVFEATKKMTLGERIRETIIRQAARFNMQIRAD